VLDPRNSVTSARRLYHFTVAKFALEDIANRTLKVAQFEDLNDPFELQCVELKTKEQEIAFDLYKADMAVRFGILCFSQRWDRILQWSHYADRHRGICLGFDVPNLQSKFGEVKYRGHKLAFPPRLDMSFSWRMLRTKYSGWSYEEEWRGFVDLKETTQKECDGRTLHFAAFADELILREVILGAGNRGSVDEIRDALRGFNPQVQLSRIHMSAEMFRLERRDI
jgi:hypothetical protein